MLKMLVVVVIKTISIILDPLPTVTVDASLSVEM
jgi:hypothetical protein